MICNQFELHTNNYEYDWTVAIENILQKHDEIIPNEDL